MNRLEGETATLVLTNNFVIQIAINVTGDKVKYQYSNEDEANEVDIEYLEDNENLTGYAMEELWQPAFTTIDGVKYFIGQFMRDNYGVLAK